MQDVIIEGWPGTYWIERHNNLHDEDLANHLVSVYELLFEHSQPLREKLEQCTKKLKEMGLSKDKGDVEKIEVEIRTLQAKLSRYDIPIALNRAYLHKIGYSVEN